MTNSNGEEIIQWIESQPELDYLRITANKTLCEYRIDEAEPSDRIIVNTRQDLALGRETFLQKIINTFWVPGEKLRGKQLASKELDNSLSTTSKLMSVSTIWDFVCTLPIFIYVLSPIAKGISGPAGFLFGFIILWASNITGENSTNRTSNNTTKATASLIAFLILSLAKTAVSGVGIDMIISKGRIIEDFASEKILEKADLEQTISNSAFSNVAPDPSVSSEYLNAQKQCEQLNQQICNLDRSKRRDRKLFKELYFDANKAPNAPCPKAASLGQVFTDEKGSQQSEIDNKQSAAALRMEDKRDMSNIVYLMKYYPEEYSTYFKGVPPSILNNTKLTGKEMNSILITTSEGVDPIDWVDERKGDAIAESTKQFFNKIQNNEIASLGMSIFAFIVSLILTSTASILLYSTGNNPEVKASFTSGLGKKVNSLMSMFRKDVDN